MDIIVDDYYLVSYDPGVYAVRITHNGEPVEMYNNVFSVETAGTLNVTVTTVDDDEDIVFSTDHAVVQTSQIYANFHTLTVTPAGLASPVHATTETDASRMAEAATLAFDAGQPTAFIDSDFWNEQVHFELDGLSAAHAIRAVTVVTDSAVLTSTAAASASRSSATRVTVSLQATPDLHLLAAAHFRVAFQLAEVATGASVPADALSPVVTITPRPFSQSRCIVTGTLVEQILTDVSFASAPQSLVLTLDSETWAPGVEDDVPALIDALVSTHITSFVANAVWFTAEGDAARGTPSNAVTIVDALRAAVCERTDDSTSRLVLTTSNAVVPVMRHNELITVASVLPAAFIRSGREDVPLITATASTAHISVQPSGGVISEVQTSARYDRDFWEGASTRITLVVEQDEWQPIHLMHTISQQLFDTYIREVLASGIEDTPWGLMIETAQLTLTSAGAMLHVDIPQLSPSTLQLTTGGINLAIGLSTNATVAGPPVFLSGKAPASTARLIVLPISSSCVLSLVDLQESQLWEPAGVQFTVALAEGDAVTGSLETIRAQLETQLRAQLLMPDLQLAASAPADARSILLQIAHLEPHQTRVSADVQVSLTLPRDELRNATDVGLPVLTVHPATPTASYTFLSLATQDDHVSANDVRAGFVVRVTLEGDAWVSSEAAAAVLRARTDDIDETGWNDTIETTTTYVDEKTVDVTVLPSSSYAPTTNEIVDIFVPNSALVKNTNVHAGSFVIHFVWDLMEAFERELTALDAAHVTVRSIIFGISSLKRAARVSTDGSSSTSIAVVDAQTDAYDLAVANEGFDARFLASDGVSARLRKLSNPALSTDTSRPLEVSDVPKLLGIIETSAAIADAQAATDGLAALEAELIARLLPSSSVPQTPIVVGSSSAAVQVAAASHAHQLIVLPRPSLDEVIVDILLADTGAVLRSIVYPKRTQIMAAVVELGVETVRVRGDGIVVP